MTYINDLDEVIDDNFIEESNYYSYFDNLELADDSEIEEVPSSYGPFGDANYEDLDFIVGDFGSQLEGTVIRSCALDGRIVGGLGDDMGSVHLNEYLFQLWQFKVDTECVSNKDGFFARNLEDYVLMLLTTVDFNRYRDYIVGRNFHIVGELRDLNIDIQREFDRVSMGEFDTVGSSANFRIVDTVEFVARHLFEAERGVTYASISDRSVDGIDAIDQYDPVFLTDCLSKGLGRLSTRLVEYNQEQTLQGVEKLFGDSWSEVLKSGVLVDWEILFEKYVQWKKELGFFSFKKFLRRMGVLRKLKLDEQINAVREVFPWIKADEIKSRRLIHPSLVRTVKSDSEGATFDLFSYDYEGNYARDNQHGPLGVDVGFVEQISRTADFNNEMSLDYLTSRRKKRTVRRKPGRPRKLNVNAVTGARAFNTDYLGLMEQNALNKKIFGDDVIDGLFEKLEAIEDSSELA